MPDDLVVCFTLTNQGQNLLESVVRLVGDLHRGPVARQRLLCQPVGQASPCFLNCESVVATRGRS
jgi:hypothetical protein